MNDREKDAIWAWAYNKGVLATLDQLSKNFSGVEDASVIIAWVETERMKATARSDVLGPKIQQAQQLDDAIDYYETITGLEATNNVESKG